MTAAEHHAAALRHLARDPVLKPFVRRHDPGPAPRRARGFAPYPALCSAILYQQLHGKAAATIEGRFHALLPSGAPPRPAEVAALPDEALRAAGLSRGKLAAIRDLTARTLAGELPPAARLGRLGDDAIRDAFVAVRGIGPWTVEMMLIFDLGRPDVLPVDDFGVREGWRIAAGLAAQPKPRELRERGAAWAPWRSTAARLLWRVADAAKATR